MDANYSIANWFNLAHSISHIFTLLSLVKYNALTVCCISDYCSLSIRNKPNVTYFYTYNRLAHIQYWKQNAFKVYLPRALCLKIIHIPLMMTMMMMMSRNVCRILYALIIYSRHSQMFVDIRFDKSCNEWNMCWIVN